MAIQDFETIKGLTDNDAKSSDGSNVLEIVEGVTTRGPDPFKSLGQLEEDFVIPGYITLNEQFQRSARTQTPRLGKLRGSLNTLTPPRHGSSCKYHTISDM